MKAFALRNGVNLDILPKRRGMRTSLDLRNLFVSSQKFFVDLLQRYYQEGHTFIVDGAVYPLVEQVQSGVRSVYVLHEHEQALEELVSLANKEGVVLKKRKVSTHQQQNHTPVNDYQRN